MTEEFEQVSFFERRSEDDKSPDIQESETMALKSSSVEIKPSKWPQFCAGYAAAMGGFNMGAILGWSSAGVQSIQEQRGAHPGVDPWISSVVCLGAIAGLFAAALLMDRVGRKWTLVLSVPLLLAGWAAMGGAARRDPLLLSARVALGAAAGIACAACPVYAAEVAHRSVRGALGVAFQICVMLGILYSFLVALSGSYVFMCEMNLLPAAVFALWMAFVPESPHFLLRAGEPQAARASLRWLRGPRCDIEEELKEIAASVEKSRVTSRRSLSDLLTSSSLRRALFVGMLLMFCQQTSGMTAVLFNLKAIAKMAGPIAGLSVNGAAILVAILQVLACWASSHLIDLYGRRPLMLISMLSMAVFHLGLVVFFTLKEKAEGSGEPVGHLAWLPVLCLCGFVVSFSVGAGPVPWVMLGEIFPEQAKCVAAAAVGIFCWLMTFIVTWAFDYLKDDVKQYTFYLVFAVACIIDAVALHLYMLETRNRTPKEIQAILEGRNPDMAPIGFK